MTNRSHFVTFQKLYFYHPESQTKHTMPEYHYHYEYEFILILSGTRYAYMDNHLHKMEAGDLLMISPYTLHKTLSMESDICDRHVMHITPDVLSPLFSPQDIEGITKHISNGLIHLSGNKFEWFKYLFLNAERHYKNSASTFSPQLRSLLFVLLSEINTLAAHAPKSNLISWKNHDFVKIMSYITENFREDITLEEVAKYSNMSKTLFCYFFKNETGTTFLHYLNSLRVMEAHRLLLESDLKINEIAEQVGFHSTPQFTRVFKSFHNIPPREVRTTKKESPKE